MTSTTDHSPRHLLQGVTPDALPADVAAWLDPRAPLPLGVVLLREEAGWPLGSVALLLLGLIVGVIGTAGLVRDGDAAGRAMAVAAGVLIGLGARGVLRTLRALRNDAEGGRRGWLFGPDAMLRWDGNRATYVPRDLVAAVRLDRLGDGNLSRPVVVARQGERVVAVQVVVVRHTAPLEAWARTGVLGI